MEIKSKDNILKYTIFFVILLGLIIRTVLFLQNDSLWNDEGLLALNLMEKSFWELTKSLNYIQAAPCGFLLLTKALIQILNPASDYTRDFILRIIPYLTGCSALILFYYLTLKLCLNKKAQIIALAFFSFSPIPNFYCAEFKQYSVELFVSVLLMLIFYKILYERKFKFYYFVIISIVPWFSYSSYFILLPYLLTSFFVDKKKTLLGIIPVLISNVCYYLISLQDVFSKSKLDLDSWWSNSYGMLDIIHPYRLILRLPVLFIRPESKILLTIMGLLLFYIIIKYYFETLRTKDYVKQVFLFGPFVLTIIASLFDLYPYASRLILFLLPYYCLYVASLTGKKSIFLQLFIFLFMLVCIPFCNYDFSYKPYSVSRDIISYIKNNYNQNDKILSDGSGEHYYYLKVNDINLPVEITPNSCFTGDYVACSEFLLNKLPIGEYFYISHFYHDKVKVLKTSGLKFETIKIGNKKGNFASIVHFRKG